MTSAPVPVRRPQAVIFDMDGLMLDTESLGPRTWESGSRASGVPFDLALLPAMVGRNHRDTLDFLIRHYGDDYPAERLTTACTEAFDAIVDADGIALKAGLVELLEWLAEHGIAHAVATSTRRERARAQLTRLGLLTRFATLVGGDDVTHGKPAPDIFLEAATRLAAPVEHCIVLEDSEPGVRAAIAAGIAPIMVPDVHVPSADLRRTGVLILPSLHDVAVHLARLPG